MEPAEQAWCDWPTTPRRGGLPNRLYPLASPLPFRQGTVTQPQQQQQQSPTYYINDGTAESQLLSPASNNRYYAYCAAATSSGGGRFAGGYYSPIPPHRLHFQLQ